MFPNFQIVRFFTYCIHNRRRSLGLSLLFLIFSASLQKKERKEKKDFYFLTHDTNDYLFISVLSFYTFTFLVTTYLRIDAQIAIWVEWVNVIRINTDIFNPHSVYNYTLRNLRYVMQIIKNYRIHCTCPHF